MDESLLHTLVLRACLGVLAGATVGFMVFQVIESIGRLTRSSGSGPTSRTNDRRGAYAGPRGVAAAASSRARPGS